MVVGIATITAEAVVSMLIVTHEHNVAGKPARRAGQTAAPPTASDKPPPTPSPRALPQKQENQPDKTEPG